MITLTNSEISGERYILNSEDDSYQDIFKKITTALGRNSSFKLVSPSTLKFIARMDSVLGVFTGKRRITTEHVMAAYEENRFSNEKIREAIGMEFKPIEQVIEHVAHIYRKEHPDSSG
jgi:hypothetical protein